MLKRRRCPHTGVVNFYDEADPDISVGSVIKSGGSPRYLWRSYADDARTGGVTLDMKTAEARVTRQYEKAGGSGA